MTLKPTSNTDLKHGNGNNLRLLSIILNKLSLSGKTFEKKKIKG